MSYQSFMELGGVLIADGTAVASTTTETALGAYNLDANFMKNDRTLRVTGRAKYSTTGTPTMIIGLRYGTATGGVLLCKTAAVTTPSGVTNAMFDFEVDITVRSNGSSGTLMANGVAHVHAAVAPTVASATGNAATTPMTNGGVTTPAVATCDFTTATPLTPTLTWSASSASNTATLLNFTVVILN